jgi:hypothetical protein
MELALLQGTQDELDRVYSQKCDEIRLDRDKARAQFAAELERHGRLLQSAIAALDALEQRGGAMSRDPRDEQIEKMSFALAEEHAKLLSAEALLADLAKKAAPAPVRRPISKAAAKKAIDSHVRGHSKPAVSKRPTPAIDAARKARRK